VSGGIVALQWIEPAPRDVKKAYPIFSGPIHFKHDPRRATSRWFSILKTTMVVTFLPAIVLDILLQLVQYHELGSEALLHVDDISRWKIVAGGVLGAWQSGSPLRDDR
jgi:hypothetical protein